VATWPTSTLWRLRSDLDAGLAHLEDRHGHRDFVTGLAGQLNLDAGLDALVRNAERPLRISCAAIASSSGIRGALDW
jgi:hypothetical protein